MYAFFVVKQHAIAVQISPLKLLQATTATSCVEISDCEEAAMDISSEEDKVQTDLTHGGTSGLDDE